MGFSGAGARAQEPTPHNILQARSQDRIEKPKKHNKMPRIEIVEYILPSHLANYLINGDADNLTSEEQKEIDDFCEEHDVRCTDADTENDYFSPSNDMTGYRLAGDVCKFTFVRNNPIDYFEKYELLPPTARAIVGLFSDIQSNKGLSYEDCKYFLMLMERIGYTFDYDLRAEPFNLRLI